MLPDHSGGVSALLPDDPTLEFRVDGKTFALSDGRRSSGDFVVWDNSGLDWSDGQSISVELVRTETQYIHWSATLTAGLWDENTPSGPQPAVGYVSGPRGGGQLSPNQFIYDGQVYRVFSVYLTYWYGPRELLLQFVPLLPDAQTMTFRIDGQTFPVRDARQRNPDTGMDQIHIWGDSGLDWANGQRISVELVSGAEPTRSPAVAGLRP